VNCRNQDVLVTVLQQASLGVGAKLDVADAQPQLPRSIVRVDVMPGGSMRSRYIVPMRD